MIKTRGRYDCNLNFPEESKSIIAEDFLVFCKLAVKHGVIPAKWDWVQFLDVAAGLLPNMFESEDCQKKWGYEFVFYNPPMGRSLKHTGEVVYGSSVLGVSRCRCRWYVVRLMNSVTWVQQCKAWQAAAVLTSVWSATCS